MIKIYPYVNDVEIWAKLNGLKVKSKKCENRKCGRTISTNIPFVSKRGIGLESSPCPCGNGGGLVTIILKSDQFENIINLIPNVEKKSEFVSKVIDFTKS